MARYRISKAETRKELIYPQLEKVGWFLRDSSKVCREIALFKQKRFAAIVARCERLRAQMPPSGMISKAERQSEILFQKLLSEALCD